ncbi:ABC transporter substrate-binding protein [Aliamphritea ceti]|uniref:ABC transporter substrate-binding protein n=1 Tax=Aliamphritea ceti TaxID=1524258 RepID=UPI0021C38670|nr:ABC transporter substrate-binding protein [Aliamphritea ceti]
MRALMFSSAVLLASLAPLSQASDFPVTVDSCGRTVTFDAAPQRAVIHDQNMSQMAFALGIQKSVAGLTGITGWYKTSPEYDRERGDIPELAPKNPTTENVLSADPDLFFAGWNYGMRTDGELTPQSLGELGVPVLELTESCVHLTKSGPDASMDLLYKDVLRLGAVFGVKEKAETLVDGWKSRLQTVADNTEGKPPVKVFLYDSGEDKIFTSGRFGMPTALIRAAGGENVMDNIDTSWGKVGIEAVMDAEPDFFILVDYQQGGWKGSWEFIKSHPVLSTLDAVKNDRFLPLEYGEITPGPLNVQAVEKLAEKMYLTGR